MRKKQIKILVGSALIVAVLLGIFVTVGSDNMTYYYTPSEVLKDTDTHKNQTVRVMGLVEEGSIQWIPSETKLLFKISDDPTYILPVEYQGAKPDMFREGQGVVIEGTLTADNRFVATALFVKHTEEYQVTDHSEKKSDYLKSLDI